MHFYSRYILPKLVHFACRQKTVMRQRGLVVPQALGTVLEVGIGSGLNFPYYDRRRVTRVWGVDPSPEMLLRARKAAAATPIEVEFITTPVETLPLDDRVADTVVMTYTMCTLAHPRKALRQMARVLKYGGKLLFCEHGAAPDQATRRWQDRLTPVWKRVGGGCHLNRDIPRLIAEGGFQIVDLQAAYISGWRPAAFVSWGTAIPGR